MGSCDPAWASRHAFYALRQGYLRVLSTSICARVARMMLTATRCKWTTSEWARWKEDLARMTAEHARARTMRAQRAKNEDLQKKWKEQGRKGEERR